MARVDSALGRIMPSLEPTEVVLGSVKGREVDGRRRRLAVATTHRVLIGWIRGGPVEELALATAEGHYDPSGGLLSLRDREQEIVLRGVDEGAARAMAQLLAQHRPSTPRHPSSSVNGVRVIEVGPS